MKTFIKILEWLLLDICMVAPVCIAITFSIGGVVATALCAVWGFPCGYIATKLIFLGEKK